MSPAPAATLPAIEPALEEAVQRRRLRLSAAFRLLCWASMALSVLILVFLLGATLVQGWPRLTAGLVLNQWSTDPARAGILSAILGSLWLIGLTTLMAVPIGVGAAVYLEEYAPPSRLRGLIQLNISNLAGVPSIVYGILGLGLFVRSMDLGKSILAGALTMTLVVLPVIILATQEALRAVPKSIRQSSFALGATRWQTVWRQVLPAATPGIMTGVILAVGRALGEAAPLVAVGAAVAVPFNPTTVHDPFTALPLVIFYWADHAKHEFHELAASAILVLLAVLVLLNAGAVLVRRRSARHIRW